MNRRIALLYELSVANAKETVRDRMAMFWFIVFPVIFVFLYGTIFNFDSSNISFNISTVTSKESNISLWLNQSISSVPAFNLSTGSQNDELSELKKGGRQAVIVVPEDAQELWESGETITLPVYYDDTQGTTGQVVLSSVGQLLQGTEQRLTGHVPRLVMDPRPVSPKKIRQIDYLLPGILAMAIMQSGLFGSLRIVGLRQQKVLKGLGATPLPRWLFLVSEVLVRLCLVLMQTAIIIGVGVAVFNVNITGSLFAVLGVVMLGAVAFVSLGYLLTSFIQTVDGGQGLIQAVQFPMLFLSGVFFPPELMPDFLDPVVRILPLSYLGDGLRQTMMGLTGEFSMPINLGVLAAWTVVCTVVAGRLWKWE